ncbi:hypothetical protein M947_07890 [Sulfurimonas hongkongensis]|uniref:DUF2254 domain-containing protein n=1 Tax=Sulfurimonas hongkongensis TaxID=1172190 RepID=T0KZR2_9BACT|nr:DUF2254 domain-containing protein [Sulfurimonas hongkongensis]EQB39073.1 hypothetical protein M947_07890 [Sulfurimonas hongkongensis]
MKIQILKYWDSIRSSFWFIPITMAIGSMVLAFVALSIDISMTEWLRSAFNWRFTGSVEGSSAVLGTIAGSMITITGVVFSMTLVALSLASSQFGPRMLRNFMRDTTTQVVLGTFIATFIYSLIVLRNIRHTEETIVFTPHFSVSLGVTLAVVSLGVLIYFIHHVSISVQANEIVMRVSKELLEGIESLFLEEKEAEQDSTEMPRGSYDNGFLKVFERDAYPVDATQDGYLQFIDYDALLTLAKQENVVLELKRRPGHYAVAGRPLVMVWPAERVDDQLIVQLIAAFTLGNQRIPRQDIECTINQLVEIAVRALSPGINDPFTAMTCVDRLGSALSRLSERKMPSPYRYDDEGELWLITPVVTFSAITDAAFDQIRQYAHSSAAVTIRLLETIAVVVESANRAEDRAALLRHAEMITKGAHKGLFEAQDRQEVEQRYGVIIQLLK